MGDIRKLYAVDLDGTLFRDDKTISKSSEQFIRNFQDQSNILCFVTGRSYENVKEYSHLLGHEGFIITNDGLRLFSSEGVLLHENENLYVCDITKITSMIPWFAYMMCFKDSREILVAKTRLSITYLMFLLKKIRKKKVCFYLLNDFKKEFKNIPIDKVLVWSSNLKKDFHRISIGLKNELQVFLLNDEKKIQIMSCKVNKLYEIRNLMSRLNIFADEVFVFGNDRNDEMMLGYFVNSYAVQNSPNDIKTVSNYVIPSNNSDGVIQKLKEIRRIDNEG